VTVTPAGAKPTGMSSECLVLVFTSIVETVALSPLATMAVLPSGVTATPVGYLPTSMSSGCSVLAFTSIVDTVPLYTLVTSAVLPSGVTATWPGFGPTAMSSGCLVLVFRSIVETVPCLVALVVVTPGLAADMRYAGLDESRIIKDYTKIITEIEET
jgi:hypothetical protein